MAANDVAADAARRGARGRRSSSSTTVPKGYRIAVITFSDHAALVAPPTLDRTRVRAALERAQDRPAGHGADRGRRARGCTSRRSVPGRRRTGSAARRRSSCSRTAAQTRRRGRRRSRRRQAREGARSRCRRSRSARRTASSTRRSRAASPSRSRCRSSRRRCSTIAQASDGGSTTAVAERRRASASYDELGSRVGPRAQDGRGHLGRGRRRAWR